jgi:hypothetical protein
LCFVAVRFVSFLFLQEQLKGIIIITACFLLLQCCCIAVLSPNIFLHAGHATAPTLL